MSSKDLWFARFKWLGGLVLLVTIVSVLLSLDRGSLERANRLYRDGETQAAAELYRVHADAPDHTAAATYNLGTALLALDDDEAEHYLRLAAQFSDQPAGGPAVRAATGAGGGDPGRRRSGRTDD
jgi:hypothetical protein